MSRQIRLKGHKYVILLDGEWVFRFATLVRLNALQQERVKNEYALSVGIDPDKLCITDLLSEVY